MQKPLIKNFINDHLLPLDIVFKDIKTPNRELPEHLHDRFELVYIYSGNGTFFLNQMLYEMNEGDLFIIPGNTVHQALPDSEFPITATAVYFDPQLIGHYAAGDSFTNMQVFERARKYKNYKLVVPAAIRPQLEETLKQIHEELERHEAGFRYAVQLHLNSLLISINRLILKESHHQLVASDIGPPWLLNILQHLDQFHTEPIAGLSYLAKHASVSTAHLSRVFKQLTGMNITDYVNAKRISTAKELLLTSDLGIDTIAHNCGYESLPYFHKLFKKFTGVTPGVYRRKVMNEISSQLDNKT
ncbi:AraC family transcriptional regulator [Paenibacillus chondroitinus]|uniref:AraC family transcriptional regulator n=1 Tax=Paenibacillus chondroitinus TaxID=59842 RepID=A0ABU6DCB5_9BACL|nr:MULTISPECIES: helix-turn-helix domain-containing protein [Paenibacillus]MCY9659982.1 AraC family transcriptional regulator [Paenibacillus anseongense]MEB4795400.1 AraC family transcriptional regulator [Paenibacillus chondroitinus]